MSKITVIDSIMGSGKTNWAIEYMNEADESEKFIYITPFLDEVSRVIEGVPKRQFLEPNNANDEGRKMRSLKELIVSRVDITSTHSLFQTADDELIELLTDSGYTLVLDEVMDCVEPINVKKADIKKLERSGDIEVVDNNVVWQGDPTDDSRYNDIRLLAQAGNLFYHRGEFLVWAFPPSVFHAMDKVILMTYLFHGQMQRYYFDLFKFDYEYKAVKKVNDNYKLIDYDIKSEKREDLFKLIDLYEGKMNDIGKHKSALSASFLRRANAEILAQLNRNLYNYFQNHAKVKRDEVYYSTLKEVQNSIAPKGYKEPNRRDKVKQETIIPINARATNDYAEKSTIAYIFNRYNNPNVNSFFQDNGVNVDEDKLAVSDLLQWIWRSRIRNGEPIQLYLPAKRMRDLLKKWANYEI